MTLVSVWKNVILKYNTKLEEEGIIDDIIFEIQSEVFENSLEYEKEIVRRINKECFDINLLSCIYKTGFKFYRDFDKITEDLKEIIFSSSIPKDYIEEESRTRFHHFDNFAINNIDLSCNINNVKIKEIERLRLLKRLFHIDLLGYYSLDLEPEVIDYNEIIEIMEGNETVKFLLNLSPFEGNDELKVYCAFTPTSHIYKPESILAKLITINPIYYQLLFNIFTIDEIMGLKEFNEKDFDLLLLSKLDLNLYNRIKDCKDISVDDLKKYVLATPEAIFRVLIQDETNDQRFLRLLNDHLRDVNIRNYCIYSDIYFNYEFIKKISYRDDLLIELLALKMIIGSENDIEISYIEDIFIQICLLFGKNIKDFYVNHREYFSHSKYHDTKNPLQKIALTLFLMKYYNYGNLQTKKLIVLNEIRTECDKDSNFFRKKYIDMEDTIRKIDQKIGINRAFINPRERNDTDIDIDIYRVGVDVHDNGGIRDDITYKAITEYIKTCNLTDEQLDDNFNEFWKFKNVLPDDKKEDFLRVLGVDEELIVKRYSRGDFGGLLNGNVSLSAMGNYYGEYNPKHILGYFWNFAKTYIDPKSNGNKELIEKERDNIKYGILVGIISSLQHDGYDIKSDGKEKYHVVCNPGKLQRIVLATLNGRFEINGKVVSIDQDTNLKEPQEGVFINSIDEIYSNLEKFFHSLYSNTPVDSEELFLNLFVYINDLHKNGIYLDPIFVVYVIMVIQKGMDGLEIKPSMSTFSNFESIINIDAISELGQIKNDIKIFEEANPHIVKAREARRLAKK